MSFSTVLRRRSARRTKPSDKDRSIALVVGLMMALVFAPVLALHVAASTLPISVDAVDLAAKKNSPGPG